MAVVDDGSRLQPKNCDELPILSKRYEVHGCPENCVERGQLSAAGHAMCTPQLQVAPRQHNNIMIITPLHKYAITAMRREIVSRSIPIGMAADENLT